MKKKIDVRRLRILAAWLLLPALVAIMLASQAHSKADDIFIGQYKKSLNYDHEMPLNTQIKVEKERADLTKYHLYFDSLNAVRVPALLFMPAKRQGPLPCVIVQHGYGGDKSFAEMFTGVLTKQGYAVIAIDAEYHGERKQAGKDIFSTDTESDLAALRQTIIDLRRVVDYLETDKRIDTKRIGYIGFSMGAFLGGSFVGVDDRVKTAILVVGGGDWATMINTSSLEIFKNMRKFAADHGQTVAEYAATLEPVDPVNFVGMISPRPVLFINGKQDVIVPPAATELLYAAANDPKEIIWYATSGHVVEPSRVIKDTTKWFKEHLEK